MRWRFIDRVDSFEPWKAIAGAKAISFEEVSLLKPFGRKGDLPESLVIESCVELVRWLVAASSGFEKASDLAEIRHFRTERISGLGTLLEIAAEVEDHAEGGLSARCRVAASGRTVASGTLYVSLSPLAAGFDAGLVEGTWRELHGEA